jgi:ribosomal protein L11 methyltransferase
MKTWIEVEARFLERPEDSSPFAEAFQIFGCNSSLETDDPPAIKGYLEAVNGSAATVNDLKEMLLKRGASEVTLSEVPDEDWSEIWKQHFKPRRVGKNMIVVPSWENFASGPDDLPLILDPGQAFGTGEHATTRLCLELLEGANPKDKRILDIGCGSGILSIAAAKLGAANIAAIDVDESAVEIARENAKLNEVTLELHAGEGLGDWSKGRTWDIVLSNIVSATLVRIALEVAQHTSPGGAWIVSGILKENWDDVLTGAKTAGFELEIIQEEDDWIAATLRKAQ